MAAKTPDHMQKVLNLIEMVKEDPSIRTELTSGDKSKVKAVLDKVDLQDEDMELINQDLDSIVVKAGNYGWWRVGG